MADPFRNVRAPASPMLLEDFSISAAIFQSGSSPCGPRRYRADEHGIHPGLPPHQLSCIAPFLRCPPRFAGPHGNAPHRRTGTARRVARRSTALAGFSAVISQLAVMPGSRAGLTRFSPRSRPYRFTTFDRVSDASRTCSTVPWKVRFRIGVHCERGRSPGHQSRQCRIRTTAASIRMSSRFARSGQDGAEKDAANRLANIDRPFDHGRRRMGERMMVRSRSSAPFAARPGAGLSVACDRAKLGARKHPESRLATARPASAFSSEDCAMGPVIQRLHRGLKSFSDLAKIRLGRCNICPLGHLGLPWHSNVGLAQRPTRPRMFGGSIRAMMSPFFHFGIVSRHSGAG